MKKNLKNFIILFVGYVAGFFILDALVFDSFLPQTKYVSRVIVTGIIFGLLGVPIGNALLRNYKQHSDK